MSSVDQPLNGACRDEPHWLVIARGFDIEAWFNDGQVNGSGGIIMPQPTKLRPHQRYYRFASSISPRSAQVGGGWWIDFETFKMIDRFAKEHGYGLSDAARLFLALPYSWTRVDRLVHAFLAVPLFAYTGRGKPATGGGAGTLDTGTKWVPMIHQEARQYYIPGLYRRDLPPDHADQPHRRAFPAPQIDFIHGNRRPV